MVVIDQSDGRMMRKRTIEMKIMSYCPKFFFFCFLVLITMNRNRQ